MPLLIIVIVASAFIVGIGSQYYLGKDNAVEEVAEVVIEKGLDLPINTIELPDIFDVRSE